MASGRKKKVLIADDSITIQKLVNLTLAGTDFEVVTAFDGFDAKNKILRMRPELVLIDSKLREVSGVKICTEIRKDKEFKSTRIVLMRANPTAEEREQMAKAGPDGYLDKPFDSKALWSLIQNLFSELADRDEPTSEKKIDSEEVTSKKAAPGGPFSSYREAEKVAPDPRERLASVAAEIWNRSEPAIPEDTHPEKVSPSAVEFNPSIEPPEVPEFNTGEVTNRVRYDDLAREEIRAWSEKNLPVIAEKLLKEEIAKFLQNKK